jgi:hypothetical protein
MTTSIKPEAIPLDLSSSLTPTRALFITHSNHQILLILDLTPSLTSIYTPEGLSLDVAANLATATPLPPVIYKLKKENLLGTHLSVRDGEGKEVAEWESPILSFHMGRTTVKFLDGEAEGETLEIQPTGFGRRSQVRFGASIHFILI